MFIDILPFVYTMPAHSHLKLYVSVGGERLQYDETLIACDYDERVSCGSRPVCDENDQNCVQDSN